MDRVDPRKRIAHLDNDRALVALDLLRPEAERHLERGKSLDFYALLLLEEEIEGFKIIILANQLDSDCYLLLERVSEPDVA